VINFFDFFRSDLFSFIPSLDIFSEDAMNCTTEERFALEEFSCSAVNNISNIIIQFSFLALIKLILYLCVKSMSKKFKQKQIEHLRKEELRIKIQNMKV
jgi:hypothetical protein